MAISSFQFRNMILTKCRFELLNCGENPNMSIDTNIIKNTSRNDDNMTATVELLIQLNKEGETVRENSPFFAEVAMSCEFLWDASFSESDINSLLTYNALTLLISYIRPVFANMSYMTPIGALNLPFINIHELLAKENKIQAKNE